MRRKMMAATLLLCAPLLSAQAPQAPKPGPEHQRLGVFVGNWTFVGQLKPGPMGAGGKMTGSDRIQWMPGNFFIERRFEGKGPMGEARGLEIMGYDSAKKAYTYSFFDSTGMMSSGTMTVSGNTWMASGTTNVAGKTMQERCSLTFAAGSTSLDIKCGMSANGKTFIPLFEGTATKAK